MEQYRRQFKIEMIARIEADIEDEIKARDSYRGLAGRLRAGDYVVEARQVSTIADVEDEHANILMTVLRFIKEKPEEIKMSGKMIEVPLERPFPKAYGDWVNVAENIKERYPDDPVMRASVNYQLGIIAREEDVTPVVEVKEVEEARRWLMLKAGELGIK